MIWAKVVYSQDEEERDFMDQQMDAKDVPQAQGEFTVREGLAYAVGAVGIQLSTVMLDTWGRFFYHPPQGDSHRMTYLSLGLAASMLLMGRIMDAVSDPIVGLWSDNSKTKWGRRRPFIIFGSLPMALTFILFWFPPIQGESLLNYVWAVLVISVFFWALTIVLVPYGALLPEIATTTHSRMKLGVYYSVGMIVGLILGQLSGYLIAAIGIRATAILFGLTAMICFQVVGWTVQERFRSRTQFSSLKEVLRELKLCFKNNAFVVFTLAQTIFGLGFFLIQMVLPDFTIVVLKRDEDFVTFLYIPFLLTCLPMTFLLPSIVKRGNKKTLYSVSLLGLALLLPFLGVIGFIPNMQMRVVASLVLVALAGIPHAAYYAVPGSFIGEMTDYDEQFLTGKRREAIYGAAQGFSVKTALSLSPQIQALVYILMGGLSHDNPKAILAMGPITGAICFIGFLVFALFYPDLKVVRDEKIKGSIEPEKDATEREKR